MPLKGDILRLLDFPGARRFLSALATRTARFETGADVEVFHRGIWVYRRGTRYYPFGRRFCHYRHWADLAGEYLSNAEDHWFHHYRPQKGDVVIDVGAGLGEDTWAFSQAVGETGRVIAIEAYPSSFEILECFCRLNRFANTTPLQAAVMDKAGKVTMVVSENWAENAVDQGNRSQGVEVQAATLDEICEAQAVTKIDFLKMNIEGAERYALPGMGPMILRVQRICVSCHDYMAARGAGEQYRTRAFVERFLTEHGFRVSSRQDDPRDYIRDQVFGLR